MTTLSTDYTDLQTSPGFVGLDNLEEIYQLDGPEAADFLNNYNTQDIKNLPMDTAMPGAFLTQKGKLVSNCFIIKHANKLLLTWPQGYGKNILQQLEVFLSFTEVEFKRVDSEWSHYLILGQQIPTECLHGLKQPESNGKVTIISCKGHEIIAIDTDRFGIPAWELLIPNEAHQEIITQLTNKGLKRLNPELLEIIRIEAGIPKLGVDMNENNLVAEMGLDEYATSFTKGCYLGQETTARIQSQGHVNKKLYQFLLEKPISGALPLELWSKEKKVGQITSYVLSPKYQRPIALGIIQTKTVNNEDTIIIQQEGDSQIVELIQ